MALLAAVCASDGDLALLGLLVGVGGGVDDSGSWGLPDLWMDAYRVASDTCTAS